MYEQDSYIREVVCGRVRKEMYSYDRTKIIEEREYIDFRRHNKREVLMGLAIRAAL